ncbi:MAG TPA: hypothetical protein VFF79_02050 [Conexibacter sp.]|jgi:hypothetical protein|nr:hypothetical protein [Conexibacter sp.]
MGVVEGVGAARPARRGARVAVEADALAWVLAVPVALLAIALIALLGPPLGRLLHSGGDPYTFWRDLRWAVVPKPTEQGRFLLALAAPLLLAGALVATVRRGLALPTRVAAVAVPLAQALLVAFAVVCVVVQQRLVYEVPIYQAGVSHRWRYFTPATLVVAAVLTAGAFALLGRPAPRARLAGWLRETDRRRLAAALLAVALTALWLLHAVNTDASIMGTSSHEWSPAQFTLDETYAVLNGRTPLVDFTAQYASLWPYLTAAALALFGTTFLVFSLAMCAITAVALLAVYALLRRIVRNGVTALLLYLPFLATSLFMVGGTTTSRYTFGDYFGVFPLRYAGPFLLAWLLVRRLEGAQARAVWPLFLAAGLVVLNNAEFGLAALAATVAALVWTAQDRSPRALARLAGQLALGLLAAYALVAALALVRTGELPQLGRLLDYGRLYSIGSFGLLKLHRLLGLHLVVYVTYAAAIVVATVRAIERAPNRPLTAMLVWSGVFGLGSAAYFMGRTHPELLVALFPTWALALTLLALDAVARLERRPSARPGLGTLLVLAGMALAVCSLAQLPLPWTQLERLGQGTPTAPLIEGEAPLPPFSGAFLPDPSTRDFFASVPQGGRFVIRKGAPVAILLTTGHQIAHAFGVVDVSRYTGLYSIVTRERLRTVVDDLRAAGGRTLFLPEASQEVYATLVRWGFERRSEQVEWGGTTVSKWVDATKRGQGPS